MTTFVYLAYERYKLEEMFLPVMRFTALYRQYLNTGNNSASRVRNSH